MIRLSNVSKYYNSNNNVSLGLRNVSLNFDKGEIVAIVGESGSGKSTLLNVICGVDTYEEGEIYFEGNETSYFNQDDMDTFRRANVSFIYQNYNIIDSYSVLENVMLPLLINGYNKKEAKKRALELIDRVGLSKRIKHRGTKLSGGEKQRCVIARALASDCPILACDEPTGNLDSKTGVEIIKLIKEVAKDKLVLIVTHNYEQVKDIVTRTITMHDGEVVEDTNPNNSQLVNTTDKDILDDVPSAKKRTLALISSFNLKNTPKKNIFSFLVLFVFCFIGFFLYISCLNSQRESSYGYNRDFMYAPRDKIIVYDKNHKTIDASKFEGFEAYPNAFYEDSTTFDIQRTNGFMSAIFTMHMPSNLKNVLGTKQITDNNFFLVVPNYYSIDDIDEFYSDNYNLYGSSNVFSLCGVAISKEVSCPTFVSTANFINKLSYLTKHKPTAYYSNDNAIKEKVICVYKPNLEKSRLLVPSEIGNVNVTVTLNNYEFKLNDFEIVVDNSYSNPTLEYNNSIINDEVYELTIYTNNSSGVERICNNLNYSYIYPAKVGNSNFSFSFISFIMLSIYSSFLMLLLVFISFIVLSRVYQSKKADYAIMRSLGLLKKQMAVVVRYEILSIGFTASVIAILSFVIISIFNPYFKDLLGLTNFGFYLFYFIMMLLFNLLLSHRFNKKLFNFSVNKTIKEVF